VTAIAQRFPGLGEGMIKTLERVNEGRAVADLEQEVARLTERLSLARETLKQRDAEIADLRAQIEQGDVGTRRDVPLAVGEGIVHNRHPAATPRQIAAQHGVNVSSVIRKLQSGKLAGAQIHGTRWLVYTDQPISFKGRR